MQQRGFMKDNKLTSREIWKLRNYHFLHSDTSWIDGLINSDLKYDNRLSSYFSQLKDYDVIEIGPGKRPLNKIFRCKSYRGVQSWYPEDEKLGYIIDDGLSFLRKQPESSSVVVSFGVWDEDILGVSNECRKGLATRYIKELSEEAMRVMRPFAIIYGISAGKYLGEPHIPIKGILDDEPPWGGIYLK